MFLVLCAYKYSIFNFRQYAIYSIETEGNISGLNTPTIMDTSGLWLKRNGLENNFIFGHIPFSTPDTTTLSEDEYYKNILEPSLYNRFPQLKGKKVILNIFIPNRIGKLNKACSQSIHIQAS